MALMRFALLPVLFCPLLAQSLTGIVTDPAGARIAGAVVQAVNEATAAGRRARSNAQGIYSFPQLPPGSYTLRAEAAGFAPLRMEGVRVLVASTVEQELRLQVATASDSVTVLAGAPNVNTLDASLGNNFSSTPILQLPFEGRNIVGLLSLQPGVTYFGDNNPSSYRSGNVNGGKADQTNITLDGVDVNEQDERASFTTAFRVSLDSVEEFRVVTTGANADLGRSSGAQITLVSKSGTNAWHGSAYHFLRNKAVNANDFFNNLSGLAVPKLNRNIYGVSAGGPMRKDSLFVFGNYEARHDRREDSTVNRVPTSSLRAGELRYLRQDRSVATVPAAMVRTQVDPAGIGANAASMAVLNRYPLPNDNSVGDGLNTAGFRFNAPVGVHWQAWMARLDYVRGSHTLFARGNLQRDRSTDIPYYPGQGPSNSNLDSSKGIAIGWNSVLGGTKVSTFRYGLSRAANEDTGTSQMPFVYFRNLEPPEGDYRAYIRKTPVHTLSEDLAWTRNRHDIRVGGIARFVRNSRTDFSNSFHEATANPAWLADGGAALNARLPDMLRGSQTQFRDAAMALLGIVSEGTAHYNYSKTGQALEMGRPVARRFDAEEYELFAQTTWRAKPPLTITAGVRWSLMPPVHEASGTQTSTRVPLGEFFARRAAFADNGLPQSGIAPIEYLLREQTGGRPLYPFHKKNFSPRFGAAWAIGKTTIRAGWGMYYDLIGSGIIAGYDSVALGLTSNLSNPSGVLTAANAPRFTGLHSIPPSLLPAAPRGGFPQVAPKLFDITTGIDDALLPPYTMNGNLTLTRLFARGWSADLSYVQRLSRRSLLHEDLAQPTNLRDPQSGVTYFEAAQQLARAALSGTPVAQIGRIPYWENLYPGAANAALSATQRVYQRFSVNAPDFISALYDVDVLCRPSCSRFGPYASFNEQYAFLRALRSNGSGTYHAMQLSVRKQFRKDDQLQLNYTLSKSIDLASRPEASIASDGTVINSWNRAQFRGVSDYDSLHQFNANWVVHVWRGWQLGGLLRQFSGVPVSVSNGRNFPTSWQIAGWSLPNGNPFADGSSDNAPAPPGGVSGPNIFKDPVAALNAFGFALPGLPGPRNGVRGEGNFNADLNLAKTFRRERFHAQFRWEVFNVTNTARFDPKSLFLSIGTASTFGKYSGTYSPPRVMQFSLRVGF